MMVAVPAPEVVAFCDKLKAKIKRRGPKAFGLQDTIVLYSGPSGDIKTAIGPGIEDNVSRSAKQAHRLGATRVDETYIGRLLGRFDLVTYFRRIYGVQQNLIDDAVFEVWAFASREFVKSGFRHVATAACGADPNRVFRAHELKVLLTEKTDVESINGVTLQHYKDIYAKHGGGHHGFYAAYVEICRSELAQAESRARKENTREAWEDYNARKLFFDVEQAAKGGAHPALITMMATKAAIEDMDGPGRGTVHSSRSHGSVHGLH